MFDPIQNGVYLKLAIDANQFAIISDHTKHITICPPELRVYISLTRSLVGNYEIVYTVLP